MKTSACRSCGAEIFWATTARNLRGIPVDAEPNARGNLVFRDGLAVYVGDDEPLDSGEMRYRAHFASCPHGKSWSKRGKNSA